MDFDSGGDFGSGGGGNNPMKRCAYCHIADVEFWSRCTSCGKPRTSATVKISIIVGVVVFVLLMWGLGY
jgi:hypothetical protein